MANKMDRHGRIVIESVVHHLDWQSNWLWKHPPIHSILHYNWISCYMHWVWISVCTISKLNSAKKFQINYFKLSQKRIFFFFFFFFISLNNFKNYYIIWNFKYIIHMQQLYSNQPYMIFLIFILLITILIFWQVRQYNIFKNSYRLFLIIKYCFIT